MGFTITKSAVVSGTGTSLQVQVPPRVAGDYIQVIVISAQTITPRATGQNRVIDIPGVAAAFEWSVLNPGSTGSVAYDLGGSGAYNAWCQILHTDADANPPPVSGPTTSNNTVRRAKEFTESVGAAVHLVYDVYRQNNYSVFKAAADYCKITHFRDGWGTDRDDIVAFLLANMPYARFWMVMDAHDWPGGNENTQTGGTSAANQLAEFQNTGFMPLLEGIEGPNERDSIATAAANYLAAREPVFRAAGVKVSSPSMALVNPKGPYDAMATVLQDDVDYVTHHPYPGGDSMMWDVILDTLATNSRAFFSAAKLPASEPIPMVFTETGFASSPNGDQGKSMPPNGPRAHQHLRIYSKSFKGLPGKDYAFRTYKYELLDDPGKGINTVEGTFGLFKSDGTPKPEATAVRNQQMLNDDTASNALTFTPTDIPGVSISGTGPVSDVLKLQKANGEWWYHIWENVVTFDTDGARVELQPAGRSVTISWTGTRTAKVYRPTASQTPIQTVSGSSITVTSSYDPIYLQVI